MKRTLLTLAALLLVSAPAGAADDKKADDKKLEGTPSEIQDMIFFGATRPVLIRLHLYIDGEPLGKFWEKAIQKRFDFADRDKDGTLSEKEIKFFPMPSTNAYNVYYPQQGGQQALVMSEVDGDSDGKVTMEEMLVVLRKKNISPVMLSGVGVNPGGQMMQQQQQYYDPNQQGVSVANRLTEALFKRLDTDKDGKLSKDELKAAEKKLLGLDDNDDETVDTAELLQQNPYNPYAYQPVQPVEVMMRPEKGSGVTKGDGGSFVLVPRDDASSRLTQRMAMTKEMMSRYDKDRSGKVTREEIGLPKDTFEQLDKNTDDVLDSFELLRWVLLAADVELVVKLGKVEGKEYAVDFAKRKGQLADKVSRTSGKGMALTMEGTQIEVAQQQTLYGYGQAVVQPNFLVQQFRALDQQEKKGFIDKKMIQKPQYQYFKAIFDVADLDDDGKLTEKEMQAYGDILTDTSRTVLTINVNEVGRALFTYVDVNKDNRLSRREMMEFSERLAALDPDKSGVVRKESIPYQFRATVTMGATYNQQQYYDPYQQVNQQRPVQTGGPTWFRKMDANRDGEVSSREFLGTPKDFEGLDANKDGIISLSEADEADARLRTKK